MEKIKRFLSKNSALLALVVLFVAASVIYPRFLTTNNLYNLMRQNSMIGIIGVAMTMVIITGGTDLSVGAICSMITVLAAKFTETDNPVFIIVVPIVIGTCIGLLNGIVVAKLNVAPIISSLGFQLVARGISLIITSGETQHFVGSAEEWLPKFSKIKLGPLPLIFVIFMAFALFFIYVLKRTNLGRKIYAVGGNEEAARMMGINVDAIRIFVYTISGFASSLAGFILVSRVASGQPVICEGWEMDAIAAVAIGGTSLSGGRGGIVGTIFGIFILAIIGNMINLQGTISSWWQSIITGIILVAVLIIQALTERRDRKKQK